MKTKTIQLYKFDELPNEIQDKVLDNLYDINVGYEWWEYLYEDAKNIGLEISSFNEHDITGEFIDEPEAVANAIIANHGEQCETYKTARKFLDEWKPIYRELQAIEESYEVHDVKYVNSLDDKCDDLITEFEKSILEDYRILLRNEYEYLTSREAILETIEANDYYFTIKGKIEHPDISPENETSINTEAINQ